MFFLSGPLCLSLPSVVGKTRDHRWRCITHGHGNNSRPRGKGGIGVLVVILSAAKNLAPSRLIETVHPSRVQDWPFDQAQGGQVQGDRTSSCHLYGIFAAGLPITPGFLTIVAAMFEIKTRGADLIRWTPRVTWSSVYLSRQVRIGRYSGHRERMVEIPGDGDAVNPVPPRLPWIRGEGYGIQAGQ